MAKVFRILLFLLCMASLLISLHLFYRQAIVIDERNLSASAFYGGETQLLLAWLRLFLQAGAAVLSLVFCFKR